jgi:hypothetical protein
VSKRRVEQLEARMDELVAQKESEINAAYDERMRNYEERYVACCLFRLVFGKCTMLIEVQ